MINQDRRTGIWGFFVVCRKEISLTARFNWIPGIIGTTNYCPFTTSTCHPKEESVRAYQKNTNNNIPMQKTLKHLQSFQLHTSKAVSTTFLPTSVRGSVLSGQFARFFGSTQEAPKSHFWLRAECKPHERRSILLPEHVEALIKGGHHVTVEKSTQRCVPDEEYEKIVGASNMVLLPPPHFWFHHQMKALSWIAVLRFALLHLQAPEFSWKSAPKDAVILGLKELPEEDTPLIHNHVYFAHVYKGQVGAESHLKRYSLLSLSLSLSLCVCVCDGAGSIRINTSRFISTCLLHYHNIGLSRVVASCGTWNFWSMTTALVWLLSATLLAGYKLLTSFFTFLNLFTPFNSTVRNVHRTSSNKC